MSSSVLAKEIANDLCSQHLILPQNVRDAATAIDQKLSGVRKAAEDILQPGILWYLTNSDRKWLDMKISTANLRGLAALTDSLKIDNVPETVEDK